LGFAKGRTGKVAEIGAPKPEAAKHKVEIGEPVATKVYAKKEEGKEEEAEGIKEPKIEKLAAEKAFYITYYANDGHYYTVEWDKEKFPLGEGTPFKGLVLKHGAEGMLRVWRDDGATPINKDKFWKDVAKEGTIVITRSVS